MRAEYTVRSVQVVVEPRGEEHGQVNLTVEPKGNVVGPFYALPTAISMLVPGARAQVENITGRDGVAKDVVNVIHPPAQVVGK